MRGRGGSDGGFTLIEVLITLVIMGIAISAILAGLGIASRSTGATRDVADASSVLTAAAERIEAATYQTCPTDAALAYKAEREAAVPTGGGSDAATPTIIGLSIWDGNSFEPAQAGSPLADTEACTYDRKANFGTAPSPSPGPGGRMQRITLGHVDDRLTFIKRGP